MRYLLTMAKFGQIKVRRRQVKRVLIITVYAFVAVVTVISLAAPAMQF